MQALWLPIEFCNLWIECSCNSGISQATSKKSSEEEYSIAVRIPPAGPTCETTSDTMGNEYFLYSVFELITVILNFNKCNKSMVYSIIGLPQNETKPFSSPIRILNPPARINASN